MKQTMYLTATFCKRMQKLLKANGIDSTYTPTQAAYGKTNGNTLIIISDVNATVLQQVCSEYKATFNLARESYYNTKALEDCLQ